MSLAAQESCLLLPARDSMICGMPVRLWHIPYLITKYEIWSELRWPEVPTIFALPCEGARPLVQGLIQQIKDWGSMYYQPTCCANSQLGDWMLLATGLVCATTTPPSRHITRHDRTYEIAVIYGVKFCKIFDWKITSSCPKKLLRND